MATKRKAPRTKPIEKLVGRPLPKQLADLLESFPKSLLELGEQQLARSELPLFPDHETLLRANQEVRAEDVWVAEGPWPPEYLVIGADPAGDRFALCLEERPPGVYRLEHSSGRWLKVAPALDAYVAKLERLARGEVPSLRVALPPIAEPLATAARKQSAKVARLLKRKAKARSVEELAELALALREEGEVAEALDCSDRCIALDRAWSHGWSDKVRLLEILLRIEDDPSWHDRKLEGKWRQRFATVDELRAALLDCLDGWLAAAGDEATTRSVLLKKAQALSAAKRYAESLTILEKLVEQDQALWLDIALARKGQGDVRGALEAIEAVHRAKPEEWWPFRHKIELLAKLGDHDRLARTREQYIAALDQEIGRTGDGWYYEAKAEQQLALGRPTQAIECLRELLQKVGQLDDTTRERIRRKLDELDG